MKPLADRIVVQPFEAEEKTKSGIIIPDVAQEKPKKGLVLFVGPGKKDESMDIKPGDKIMYGKFAGIEIEVDDKKCLIMRQSDIYAIIK